VGNPSLLLCLLLSGCATAAAKRTPSADSLPWVSHGGVEFAEVGNDPLLVVRADLRSAPLELVNQGGADALTLAGLAARDRFAVLTNAAMFGQDYRTSIGYMRNFGVVNNPHVAAKLRGFLLFHPKRAGLPALKMGTVQDISGYDTVVQTHRVWTPEEGILWNKGASVFYQVGLVGVDGAGRILFFHHPGLADVHDLAEQILALGLDVRALLYLDGGHHGALYLDPALGRGGNESIVLPNLLGLKFGKE
jgi:hypothetical protein